MVSRNSDGFSCVIKRHINLLVSNSRLNPNSRSLFHCLFYAFRALLVPVCVVLFVPLGTDRESRLVALLLNFILIRGLILHGGTIIEESCFNAQ